MSGSKIQFITERASLGFGMRALKMRPELLPLVASLGLACGMATAYGMYALYQKPDVRINKYATHPAWERIDPETPQKLVTVNLKYKKIPELEQLRKEIGSYKY